MYICSIFESLYFLVSLHLVLQVFLQALARDAYHVISVLMPRECLYITKGDRRSDIW